jgi:nucleoside-diphosphate-sugar epimerase
MKKNILITGGTGTIGTELVRYLTDAGYFIRLFALPEDTAACDNDNVEVRYGDICNPEDVNGLCDGIDTVLHMAAVIITDDDNVFDRVNIKGTQYLLADAKNNKVKHFIHISSASVVYRKMTPYSRSKRIAERYVKQSSLPWTIVRPTLVYGERGGLEFDMFVRYLSQYPVIPFIGNGKALKRPVYVRDLVTGLAAVASLEKGDGRVYNLSGGSAISMLDFARLCLTFMGKEDKLIVHIPVLLCRILAAGMKKFMKKPLLTWNMIAGVMQDANLDPSDATDEFGYAPLPVEKKLCECFPRQTVI